MSRPRARFRRGISLVCVGLLATAVLAGCGGDSDDEVAASGDAPAKGSAPISVTVGALSNGAATETTLEVSPVEAIRSKLPKEILDSGELVIGLGLLPAGSPPLGYVGTDQKTLTCSEPDLGRLVAAVLGLKPVIDNATWANLFVGLDSGKTDVGISNITDTEERKKKYDFASYRKDDLGFEVLKDSTFNFNNDYKNLAGLTVAVGSGTNQEKILLEWQSKLKSEGKELEVKTFPDNNATYLALASKKIDAYFTPNPSAAYHIAQSANTPTPTRSAGTYSGAGATLQGLIAATVKKDSGLAQPLADAINHLIENGQYATWLAAWNLSNEAVPSSLVNPPGLPLDNA